MAIVWNPCAFAQGRAGFIPATSCRHETGSTCPSDVSLTVKKLPNELSYHKGSSVHVEIGRQSVEINIKVRRAEQSLIAQSLSKMFLVTGVTP